MEIKKDLLEKEIEQWKGYYNNYNDLSLQIVADVLAYYKPKEREEFFKKVNNFLETFLGGVKNPIGGAEMVDAIKGDIEMFDRKNDEAAFSLRTLEWIKSIEDVEEAKIEEIEEKVVDKE